MAWKSIILGSGYRLAAKLFFCLFVASGNAQDVDVDKKAPTDNEPHRYDPLTDPRLACRTDPSGLEPFYYEPFGPDENLTRKGPEITFRLEGAMPCSKAGCKLLIVDAKTRRTLAFVRTYYDTALFCSYVKPYLSHPGDVACSDGVISSNRNIYLNAGSPPEPYRLVAIDYNLAKTKIRPNPARLCVDAEAPSGNVGTVDAWKLTTSTGAVITINDSSGDDLPANERSRKPVEVLK